MDFRLGRWVWLAFVCAPGAARADSLPLPANLIDFNSTLGERYLIDLLAQFARSGLFPAILRQGLPAPNQGQTAFAQLIACTVGTFEHAFRILTAHRHALIVP